MSDDTKPQETQEKDWYDLLVEKGRERVEKSEDPFAREGGRVALKLLEENKKDLIGLGKDALTKMIGRAASGHTSEAIRIYIENCTDPQALIDGVADSADRIVDADKKAREEAERAANVVKRIAGEAARFLLPIVLGAV